MSSSERVAVKPETAPGVSSSWSRLPKHSGKSLWMKCPFQWCTFAQNDQLKNVPVSLALLFNFRCGMWMGDIFTVASGSLKQSFSAESCNSSHPVKTVDQSWEPESVSDVSARQHKHVVNTLGGFFRGEDERHQAALPSSSSAPVTDGQSLLSTRRWALLCQASPSPKPPVDGKSRSSPKHLWHSSFQGFSFFFTNSLHRHWVILGDK